MRTYKVLYVFCFEHHSGAEIVMKRLISKNRANVKPTIMCPPGVFATQLISEGFDVIPVKELGPLKISENKGKLKSAIQLAIRMFKVSFKVLRAAKGNDVIHINNLIASFYALPAVVMSKILSPKRKFIWSNHDLVYFSGSLGDKLASICHKFYDRIIAVSSAVKRKFPKYADKIDVLYNGLDLQAFSYDAEKRKAFRLQWNLDDDVICIAILGSIVSHKGQALLIKAFESVLKASLNVKLFIIGRFTADDENAKIVKDMIAKLPQNSITLISHTDDVQTVYSGIDIVVNSTLSYISEPLGTTIYEGMAFKRVVIASNTGGTPEIVDDKINGFLFDADNSDSLADKLTYVINNIENFDELKNAAAEKVHRVFNISTMVYNYNIIISSLIG